MATRRKPLLKKVLSHDGNESDYDELGVQAKIKDRKFSGNVGLGVTLSLLSFLLFVGAELSPMPELYLPLTVVAGMLAALAVFLTYNFGGGDRYESWSFFQPLQGGVRFVVLQIIGWSFFALSIVIPGTFLSFAALYPGVALRGVAIIAGAAAMLSEISVVASLLLYRPSASSQDKIEQVTSKHGLQTFLITETGKGWWKSFIGLQALLTLIGLGLTVAADIAYNTSLAWVFAGFFAVACFAISAFFTHGIGGPWRNHTRGWRFFQPGIGGARFVVLQGLSWAFFSIGMCIFLSNLLFYVPIAEYLKDTPFMQTLPSMTTGGIAALLSQLLLTASLFVFKKESDVSVSVSAASTASTARRLHRLFWVVLLYNVQLMIGFLTSMSVSISHIYPKFIVISWLLGFLFYAPTYLWAPSVSGRRAWKQSSYQFIADLVGEYFSLEVFASQPNISTKDGKKYIFGYHPHGLLPVSCAWSTSTSKFAKLFPDLRLAYLTASITHAIPMLRDIGEVFGSFEVTPKGFISALQSYKAVIVVPGGQAEMLFSKSDSKELKLNSRHRGFVRMAIEHGASLVPVIAFDEVRLLDNFPIPDSVQKWFMRVFRANFCFCPYGVGYLSIPRPEPFRLVIGDVISFPQVVEPTSDMVDAVHRQYFKSVRKLYEDYKHKCGHGTDKLVLVPEIVDIGDAEWQNTLKVMQQAHQEEDPGLRDRPRVKVHTFDAFRTHEGVWVTIFFIVVFLVTLVRAWPTLWD